MTAQTVRIAATDLPDIARTGSVGLPNDLQAYAENRDAARWSPACQFKPTSGPPNDHDQLPDKTAYRLFNPRVPREVTDRPLQKRFGFALPRKDRQHQGAYAGAQKTEAEPQPTVRPGRQEQGHPVLPAPPLRKLIHYDSRRRADVQGDADADTAKQRQYSEPHDGRAKRRNEGKEREAGADKCARSAAEQHHHAKTAQ